MAKKLEGTESLGNNMRPHALFLVLLDSLKPNVVVRAWEGCCCGYT